MLFRSLEQAENFLCGLCPVLDGVHSILQRHLNSFRTLYMSGHRQSQAVSLVAGRLYQLWSHTQDARLSLFLCIQHAASNHQLDQIGLVLGYLSYKGGGSLR